MSIQENIRLMNTFDDAWNSQDSIFNNGHSGDIIVHRRGRPHMKEIVSHKKKGEYFLNALPDNYIRTNQYKIFFGQGECPRFILEFTGSHKGPMMNTEGKMMQSTNMSFNLDFCTEADSKDDKILEEDLFYDLIGVIRQMILIKMKQ
jgi:hypothetical protein